MFFFAESTTEYSQDLNGSLSSEYKQLKPTVESNHLPLTLKIMFISKQISQNISTLIQHNKEIILENSAQPVELVNHSIKLNVNYEIDEKHPTTSFSRVYNIINNKTSDKQDNTLNTMSVLNSHRNNFTIKFANKTSVHDLITKFRNISTENSTKFRIEQNIHLINIENKTKRTDSLVNTFNKTFENILPTSKEVNNFNVGIVNETIVTENLNVTLNNSEKRIEKVIKEHQEVSSKLSLVSLSQIIKDQHILNKTRMKVSYKNETLKSLGSVELMLPNFNDKSDVKNLYKSLSVSGEQVVSPTKSDRTDNQALSRTDSPMLNYIFDTHANLNKHQHRNDR